MFTTVRPQLAPAVTVSPEPDLGFLLMESHTGRGKLLPRSRQPVQETTLQCGAWLPFFTVDISIRFAIFQNRERQCLCI